MIEHAGQGCEPDLDNRKARTISTPESPSAPPHIQVLLATYNGARFLRPQLDSILGQDYSNLSILAGDDGSQDETLTILNDYAQAYPGRVAILPKAPPTGSPKLNFARLMRASTADYLATADQDDVWMPDKISRSMSALQALEQIHGAVAPLLVFSDLKVVDDELHVLNPSFWAHQGIPPSIVRSFRKLVSRNVVTGCTALFNRTLSRLAQDMPPAAYMHDWWLALIACGLGAVDYISEPTVLYRQHAGNLLGAVEQARPNLIPSFRYHTMRRRQWETTAHQAEAFLLHFGDRLPPEKRRPLQAYVRCESSRHAGIRVLTYLFSGIYQQTLRQNGAMLWYLMDMNADKRRNP